MSLYEGIVRPRLTIRELPVDSDVPALKLFERRAEIIDSTGIPLNSNRVDPKLIEGVNFGLRPNRFKNSPSRHPNGQPHSKPISELERKRLATHYSEMMAIVTEVRNTYITKIRNKGMLGDSGPLAAAELRSVLQGLFYLPSYLVNRAENPVEAQGVIPPAIIILSNAASGTLGALRIFLDHHGENLATLQVPPDPVEMVELTEQDPTKPIVGKETVCVASREVMHHFIASVIQGPRSHYAGSFDAKPWVHSEETASFINFGYHAYEASAIGEGFSIYDADVADEIDKMSKKKKQKGKHLPRLQGFLNKSVDYRVQLEIHQLEANKALGRSIYGPSLTIPYLEERFRLRVPAMLRENNLLR